MAYYKDPKGGVHVDPPQSAIDKFGLLPISDEEGKAIELARNTPPPKTLDELKADKLAAINIEKNRIRDGGFLVGEILFDSDLSARTSYAELGLAFVANPAFTVENYKASSGHWVTMDVTLYQQIMESGRIHLQSVFDWFRVREEAVNACTSKEQLALIGETFNE